MIEITNVCVAGFEPALRGMRNSYNSWDRADSTKVGERISDGWIFDEGQATEENFTFDIYDPVDMGKADTKLADALVKSGSPEAKFRRMIHVWMDINAPLYWWKQFDTYKVGTTANSTSTMHSIVKHPFVATDFSYSNSVSFMMLKQSIDNLNELRAKYLRATTIDEKNMLWNAIIDNLPESYNQLRTVDINYEVLAQIYKWRLHHKLPEWRDFCEHMIELPYSWIFTGGSNKTW